MVNCRELSKFWLANDIKIYISISVEEIHLAFAQTDVRNMSFIPMRSKTLVNFFAVCLNHQETRGRVCGYLALLNDLQLRELEVESNIQGPHGDI